MMIFSKEKKEKMELNYMQIINLWEFHQLHILYWEQLLVYHFFLLVTANFQKRRNIKIMLFVNKNN